MKTPKILFLSFYFLTMSFLSFGNDTKPQTLQLENQIKSLLLSNTDALAEFGSETVKLNFLINSKSEIIILSTNNSKMDDFVKSVLNYKKVSIGDLEYEKIYTLPLVFKS